MIGVIARKECRELLRDGRLRLAAAVLWLAIFAGGLVGWSHYLDVTRRAEHAATNERQRWLDQGEKHPHSAAHYGVFAFKTPRPLSIVDSGIETYVGSTLWLEAHKQNETLYRPAEDATALRRFGDLSIASVLRVLAPLLVIMVGFSAFSGEREAGTLRQLASLGVKPRDLLFGKAIGVAAVLLVVLVPAFVFAFVASTLGPANLVFDELARAALMGLAYALYLGGFVFLVLAVSAFAKSSRVALVVLLVFWATTIFIFPRAVSDEAKALHPTEAAIAQKHELEASLVDAHGATGKSARLAALVEKYEVAKAIDLPLDLSGVSLQDGEERNYPVFEKHYGAFRDILREQDRLYQIATIVAPATGLQLVSMALAGSDLEHHHDFVDQAEATRRAMQATINEGILATSEKNAEGQWRARAGRDLWEKVPDFVYRPPTWREAARPYGLAFGLLGFWFAAAFGAALVAVSRLKVA
jgi:ABC-2 type transport system permease protein